MRAPEGWSYYLVERDLPSLRLDWGGYRVLGWPAGHEGLKFFLSLGDGERDRLTTLVGRGIESALSAKQDCGL